MELDYIEIEYLSNKVIKGALSKEALSQRIGRALKSKNHHLYLTLKVVQAEVRFQEETNEDKF